MTESKARALFERRWDDVRVASPRKLYRILDNFLTDHGYEHEYEELKLESSPIEGTATFRKPLEGKKDIKRRRRWGLLIAGIFLCLLVPFIAIGIILIRRSGGRLRTTISLDVEGEAYRARGAEIEPSHQAEVLDVVADARITLKADSGRPNDKEGPYAIGAKIKDKKEIEALRVHFEDLEKRLEQLLPTIVLPEIKGPTAKL